MSWYTKKTCIPNVNPKICITSSHWGLMGAKKGSGIWSHWATFALEFVLSISTAGCLFIPDVGGPSVNANEVK